MGYFIYMICLTETLSDRCNVWHRSFLLTPLRVVCIIRTYTFSFFKGRCSCHISNSNNVYSILTAFLSIVLKNVILTRLLFRRSRHICCCCYRHITFWNLLTAVKTCSLPTLFPRSLDNSELIISCY